MTVPSTPLADLDADLEQRLVDILNDAALALMLSIGHRTGLLDALGAGPTTCVELAERAGCDERYVREWLGALTAGNLVRHDATAASYALPSCGAELLTRSGATNFAVYMQYVAVLAGVEDDLIDCFRNGGGLGYEHFPRFHEVMAEESTQTVLAAMNDVVLPLVPGLAERLESGIDVIDVGCGRGGALIQLAERYPASRFIGVDLTQAAITNARQQAAGLPNLRFHCHDAAELGDVIPASSVDLAFTFDAIHDQAQPAALLRGIHQALRTDGVYLAQDIAGGGSHAADAEHPIGAFLYTISCLHCLTVSLSAGGEGLGAMWGVPTAQRYLAEAGFVDVQVHRLEHDVQNVYYVARSAEHDDVRPDSIHHRYLFDGGRAGCVRPGCGRPSR